MGQQETPNGLKEACCSMNDVYEELPAHLLYLKKF